MNLKQMQQSLQLKLNDPQGSFYTLLQLTQMLNTSMQFVYNKLIENKIYTRKSTVDIIFTSNVQETAFVSNIHKLIAAYDSDSVPVPIYEEEFSKQSSNRSVYFRASAVPPTINVPIVVTLTVRQDKLGWYRKPSSTFTITILFAEKLTLFDENNAETGNFYINDIPEEYHEVIILRATEVAWASKGLSQENIPTIQYWQAKFAEEFDAMINTLGKQADTQQHVIDVYT